MGEFNAKSAETASYGHHARLRTMPTPRIGLGDTAVTLGFMNATTSTCSARHSGKAFGSSAGSAIMADLPSMEINPGAARAPSQPGAARAARRGQLRVDTPHLLELPSPLREVANSLSKASDETNEVAKLYAKQAGYQAVTRDDQGNLVVAQAPIVGDAAIAYHSAVKFSALSMGEAEAKRQDLVLSKQFHDNPDGYLEAAQAFQKKHVEEFTKAAGADVGADARPLDRQQHDAELPLAGAGAAAQHQAEVRSRHAGGDPVADEDAISAIQTGAKPGDPTVQALIDKRISRPAKMRVQNPVLGKSPDVGSARRQALRYEGRRRALRAGLQHDIAGSERRRRRGAGGAGIASDKEGRRTGAARARLFRGQKAIKDHYQNLERSVNLANKAQKQTDQQFEDASFKGLGVAEPDDHRERHQDGVWHLARSQDAHAGLAEARRHAGAACARLAGEPMDLFRRMNLPEDDPAHQGSAPNPRRLCATAQPGLTRQDEDWLEKRFKLKGSVT
jgi:hypothetical protein